MNIKQNNYIPAFSESEIYAVNQKLNPQKNRACNNNILFSAGESSYSGNFYGHSLKRSNLKNCSFDGSTFDHTSFCGSIFENVTFKSNCKFESVYLEQSIMDNVKFGANIHIENCNFSSSQLKNIQFSSLEIRGAYFDNSFLYNCSFKNCKIRASMFDGAFLTNCLFADCNMRNLNIEFATFDKCDLTGTTISYFQFPYIIGIFSKTNKIENAFVGINKNQTIPISEYLDNIDDALVYFSGLNEYFPLANLYYAKGDNDISRSCILCGIQKSLLDNDIRMVENYCKLGQVYDLLSVNDIKDILKEVDKEIEKKRNHPMYGILLSKSYHLKASISQNNSKAKLEIIVNTNINGNRYDIVGEFCDDIDSIISSMIPNKISTTYQLSHNSPFEICLTCIGMTADLVAIAGPIYQFISHKMKKDVKISADLQEYIKQSNKMYLDSLDNQFDLFEESLKGKKKSEYSEIIKDFRGKIITTATDQINKDLALLVSQYSQE